MPVNNGLLLSLEAHLIPASNELISFLSEFGSQLLLVQAIKMQQLLLILPCPSVPPSKLKRNIQQVLVEIVQILESKIVYDQSIRLPFQFVRNKGQLWRRRVPPIFIFGERSRAFADEERAHHLHFFLRAASSMNCPQVVNPVAQVVVPDVDRALPRSHRSLLCGSAVAHCLSCLPCTHLKRMTRSSIHSPQSIAIRINMQLSKAALPVRQFCEAQR
mmetsp:Transcript_59997/g.99705  ORF Transcript_59997/g.99705 Transcript_59997/m.99705 type:complete len:217 (-) Transcript_59997:660-1310(-)